MKRWRWEFYRRREDLREYFDKWAEKTHQDNLRLSQRDDIVFAHSGLTPVDPGFAIVASFEARRKFGYATVPNPRIGNQPEGLIKPVEEYEGARFVSGAKRDGYGSRGFQIGGRLELAGVSLTKKQQVFLDLTLLDQFPVPLEQHEAAVTFDLNGPLEPQLKKARAVLRKQQEKQHGKFVQKRHHREKWLDYLRTLDAVEEDAHWSQIAPLLQSTNQEPHSARDVWKQALKMQHAFKFYTEIGSVK